MFKALKERKVVNLKESCKLDMDIMRTIGNVEIAKLEVENDVLQAQNNTLNLKHKNILLQNENGLFDRLKHSGKTLTILASLSCLVSTTLSLIGGYLLLNNIIKFVGYALVMIICQVIIFVSSRYGTITKDKFIQHYYGLKLMQILMLAISFTMNILFFHECFNSYLMDLIMSPLCFVLDYSTLVFNSLGYDQKTLNFNSNKESQTVFDMFFDNLTYKAKSKIYNTYYNNHHVGPEKIKTKILLEDPLHKQKKVLKLSQKFKNKKFIKKVDRVDVEQNKLKNNLRTNLDQKYNKIQDYLRTEYKPNDYVKSFRTKFKLTVTEHRKVMEKLKKDNIIYTDNKKTYLKQQLKLLNQGKK